MYAFLDAEFNADKNNRTEREDHSLIEVALIITDDKCQPVEIYHTFVKPKENHGKLYPRIRRLTGISQKDINAGVTYNTAIADMHTLINRYNIEKIFTYGDYDKTAFKWNNKYYGRVSYGNAIAKKLTDVSGQLRKLCKIKYEVSLETLAYICGTENKVTHTATDDAQTLREVCMKVNTGNIDEEKCRAYNEYVLNRNSYNKMLVEFNALTRKGMQKDVILEMLKRRKTFPKFSEMDKNT